MVDIFKAVVFRKIDIKFELRKVPGKDIIYKLIKKVKKHYPNIYKVLVVERNEFMAKMLRIIMQQNEDKKILAIVGAGHEEDIIKLLKKYKNQSKITYNFTFS